VEGIACGGHLEGFEDAGGGLRVWDEYGSFQRFAIALGAHLNPLAHIAHGRAASRPIALSCDLLAASEGILAQVTGVELIDGLDDALQESSDGAFRHGFLA